MAYITPTFTDFCEVHKLTENESQVVDMLLHGATNKEVAKERGVTEQVIKNMLRRVWIKLNIDGNKNGKKIQLILFVKQWGKEERARRIISEMNG